MKLHTLHACQWSSAKGKGSIALYVPPEANVRFTANATIHNDVCTHVVKFEELNGLYGHVTHNFVYTGVVVNRFKQVHNIPGGFVDNALNWKKFSWNKTEEKLWYCTRVLNPASQNNTLVTWVVHFTCFL